MIDLVLKAKLKKSQSKTVFRFIKLILIIYMVLWNLGCLYLLFSNKEINQIFHNKLFIVLLIIAPTSYKLIFLSFEEMKLKQKYENFGDIEDDEDGVR